MSEPYFTNNAESNGTQTMGRPYAEQGPHQGYSEFAQTPGRAHPGMPFNGGVPPQPGTGAPGSFLQSLPPRGRQVLAVLALTTVGLGGFGYLTHSDLAQAETKAHGLSESLTTTKDSLGAKQAELEKTQQQLTELQQSSEGAAAALESTTQCASLLNDAWTAYFAKDFTAAQTAYDAAQEPCGAALGSE
jgi:hypothetical protein